MTLIVRQIRTGLFGFPCNLAFRNNNLVALFVDLRFKLVVAVYVLTRNFLQRRKGFSITGHFHARIRNRFAKRKEIIVTKVSFFLGSFYTSLQGFRFAGTSLLHLGLKLLYQSLGFPNTQFLALKLGFHRFRFGLYTGSHLSHHFRTTMLKPSR